jgi:hypothetical protein
VAVVANPGDSLVFAEVSILTPFFSTNS